MTGQSVKTIGIAIVEFEGSVVVGQRKAGQELAGFAEFPGGKCEPGEDPEDCVVRECLEETGLSVRARRLLTRTQFQYPHASVDLHFWLCGLTSETAGSGSGFPEALNGFRWQSVDQLADLSFPDANREVLQLLAEGSFISDGH